MFRRPDRRTAARLSAFAAASAMAVGGTLAMAGPAHADGVKGKFQGFADVDKNGKSDDAVDLQLVNKDGKTDTQKAGLFDLKLETGEVLKVYCVDYANPTSAGNEYSEGKWDSWPTRDASADERRAKIKWILLNAYPTTSVDTLKTKAGAPDLDAKEASAATQAALWHFSDQMELKDDKSDIAKLYKYLVDNASGADKEEPKISLKLTPEEQSKIPEGAQGVGPFKVETNAEGKAISAKLKDGAPAGTKLVDKTGNPVTKAGNGDELYVKFAPGVEKGQAGIEVSGTSKLDAGRIFTGKAPNGKASQKLILAEHQSVNAKAEAKATFAAKGPAPAITAEEKCAEGGLEVTVANNGDMPYDFTLDNKKSTVKPKESVKQLVKIGEDESYTVQVIGPDNKPAKEFTGTLDCKTSSSTGGGTVPAPSTSAPAPAPAPSGPELAETGGDGSNSALYLSGAGVLLLGGGLVFFVVRRRAGAQS